MASNHQQQLKQQKGFKMPTLNTAQLTGKNVVENDQKLTEIQSQVSTQMTESVAQFNAQSFYTSREADPQYKIQGIQVQDTLANVQSETNKELEKESQEALDKKKKRKKRKKNKKNKDIETVAPQAEAPTQKRALKDELSEGELFADSDVSEDEGIPDYKIGGYHPVHVGEVMINRYVIVQKLGWGHFSTVWLARDMQYKTYVALKVQKSASHYQEAAYDEVEILDVVARNAFQEEWKQHVENLKKEDKSFQEKGGYGIEDCHTVQLLNSFIHSGPNGQHFIMVFEILGVNLLEIMKRYDYKGIPLPLVRRMAKQVLIGLDYLHRVCRIIHTDLKPENVIVSLTKSELEEIMNRGQISTMNKNVKTLNIMEDVKLFQTQPAAQKLSLLENVDTTGLNRQQKKKLKKKIKKQLNKEQDQQKEEDVEKISGAQTMRERRTPKKSKQESPNKPKPQDNSENADSDTESLEMPKSHSVPNMTWKEYGQGKEGQESDDSLFEDDDSDKEVRELRQKEKDGSWQYQIKRDFQGEIDNFFQLKKKKQENKNKKKVKNQIEKDSNMHERGPLINENISLKICDLGNGCWTHHHFTSKIQTRQYRGPEVMLGIDYDTSADLWSFACMIYELITGDFLFDPRKGQNYSKTDDHLAQMIEMLGPMPKNYALSGSFFDKFFKKDQQTNKYVFKNITGLRHFPLNRLLMQKYRFKQHEADMLADFLLPILKWYPSERPSAQQMLQHPWLNMPDDYNYKMSDLEYQKYQMKSITLLQQEEQEKKMEGVFAEKEDDLGIGELVADESELAEADNEDNESLEFEDTDESLSFTADAGKGEEEQEFQANVSFSGGYIPNTDLSRVDKGMGNSQFKGLSIK